MDACNAVNPALDAQDSSFTSASVFSAALLPLPLPLLLATVAAASAGSTPASSECSAACSKLPYEETLSSTGSYSSRSTLVRSWPCSTTA